MSVVARDLVWSQRMINTILLHFALTANAWLTTTNYFNVLNYIQIKLTQINEDELFPRGRARVWCGATRAPSPPSTRRKYAPPILREISVAIFTRTFLSRANTLDDVGSAMRLFFLNYQIDSRNYLSSSIRRRITLIVRRRFRRVTRLPFRG